MTRKSTLFLNVWYATFNCKSGVYPFLIDEVKPWRVSLVSMSIWQEKLARPFLTAREYRKEAYH
jgi:hypothetical protein